MYKVATRTLPERSLLCRLRHVASEQETFALGKEFIAIFRERPLPLIEGIEDAPFLILIYHGEVSADSDGPVEYFRPVPAVQAKDLAARYPELTLRTSRLTKRPSSTWAHPVLRSSAARSGSSSLRACAVGARPSNACPAIWMCG